MREEPYWASIGQIQWEIRQAIALVQKIPSCADAVPVLEMALEQVDGLAALLSTDE